MSFPSNYVQKIVTSEGNGTSPIVTNTTVMLYTKPTCAFSTDTLPLHFNIPFRDFIYKDKNAPSVKVKLFVMAHALLFIIPRDIFGNNLECYDKI